MKGFPLPRLFRTGRRLFPHAPRQTRLLVEPLEERRLLTQLPVLGGHVYYDANDNGIFDSGDRPIAGSQVELRDAAGRVAATAVSGTDGSYQFGNHFYPTVYTIVQPQVPEGYLPGRLSRSAIPVRLGVGMGPNEDNDEPDGDADDPNVSGLDHNDFGAVLPASLSGSVLEGRDTPGSAPDGRPLSGVEVLLTGTDDLGHAVRLLQETAPDGSYHFTGLRPGVYALEAAPAEGHVALADVPGTAGGAGHGPADLLGIALEPGVQAGFYDFIQTPLERPPVPNTPSNSSVPGPEQEPLVAALPAASQQQSPAPLPTVPALDAVRNSSPITRVSSPLTPRLSVPPLRSSGSTGQAPAVVAPLPPADGGGDGQEDTVATAVPTGEEEETAESVPVAEQVNRHTSAPPAGATANDQEPAHRPEEVVEEEVLLPVLPSAVHHPGDGLDVSSTVPHCGRVHAFRGRVLRAAVWLLCTVVGTSVVNALRRAPSRPPASRRSAHAETS